MVQRQLPSVRGEAEDLGDGEFDIAFFDTENKKIGRSSVTVIAGAEKLYVRYIEVENQRQGFGLAMLTWLAGTYFTGIVPVRPNDSAIPFWNYARDYKDGGFTIGEDIDQTSFRVLTGAIKPSAGGL